MLEPNERIAYLSDLSDQEWEIIKTHISIPLLIAVKMCSFISRNIECNLLFATLWLCLATVTSRLSTLETVYLYFRVWRLNGTWEQITAELRTDVRVVYSRKSEPSAAILDSQSVKTTETSGARG